MVNSSEKTTLVLSKELRNELAQFGKKDDSFEMIIRRLIAFKKLSPATQVKEVEAKIKEKWEGKV